jgi:two-component system response regulator TctD
MTAERPARILVVDDDPLLLELLTDTLTAIGYETAAASDGAIALDMLQTEQYDLMISDIKMPRVDGLQLLRRVRRHYPRLPVLFITGVASQETIGSVSPDGILAKPFRIAHIESMIQQALQRKNKPEIERQKELLILDGAARIDDHFLSDLSASGYVPFAYSSINDAAHELSHTCFSAILADIAPFSADPVELMTRLRRLAPNTPLILNADLFPGHTHERIISEYQPAGFSPAPFSHPHVIELLDTLVPLPRR